LLFRTWIKAYFEKAIAFFYSEYNLQPLLVSLYEGPTTWANTTCIPLPAGFYKWLSPCDNHLCIWTLRILL